jgi:type I restriction enzyme M protein
MTKEIKLEDNTPFKAIQAKIWDLFDILKKEPIHSEDYHVILFLLSIFKDGLISTDFFSEKAKFQDDSPTSIKYLAIYQSFMPIISRLTERGFISIIQVISSVDKKVLSENFPDIFDSVLYRITQSQGRYSGEFIQPVELTRLICALADLPKKSRVFNPFAGLASFGVYLDQSQDYYGQEINQKTWALGALRIMAYDTSGISNFVCDDSILHWPASREKFDLIVANPPYGMRLSSQYRDVEPGISTIEQFLVEKGVHSLNENGKLIALLPQGFLFRGMHEQRLREFLIEEDLIDTIISLPGGLLLNTGIPLIILVVSKNKKTPGTVRFVDAKNFVLSKNSREKVLNDYELNSVLNSNNLEFDFIRFVRNEEIRSQDYNLNVPRYFQKEIDGIKLGEILEFVRGQRGSLPKSGKLIRIRDLKDDKVDFKLEVTNVESTEFRRPDIHLIDESCLLLAMRWRTLKPTLYEFTGEPIYRSQDILSFKVNESIVDTAYLINELHADYVQEQLDSYRLGGTIPIIRREDLFEVVIKVPSLDKQKSLELQRAKVQGIYELSEKIKGLQEERNALVHGKSIKQYSEFASLKHTLGRPRQNILDWSDNLLHFLNSNHAGFDELNKTFAEFYEIDIISALKEIKRDVNFITDVLEKGENGFVIEEFDKQIIPLADINNIINEFSSNGFNFKIKKLLIKGEKLKERGIYGNRTLFKTLFDNLLTNASKYG